MRHFNWIDVVVLLLLIRIIYSGVKQGFSVEIFKFLATTLGIVVAAHNFPGIAAFLNIRLFIPLWLARILSFLSFIALVWLVFFGLRLFLLKVMKVQFIPSVEKGGGIIFSLLRAVVVISIILIMLSFLPVRYFNTSIKYSLSGPYFLKVAPKIYRFCIRFYPYKTVSEELQKTLERGT